MKQAQIPATRIACAFPTGSGTVELIADGPVIWVDPRGDGDSGVPTHLRICIDRRAWRG